MARRRGGYQRPSQPAAVSGPGALSARTDGGPADLRHTGLPYGQNQALAAQQAAAPMPGDAAAAAAGGGGGPVPFTPMAGGVFGPSSRPGEAITAGMGAPTFEPDPDALLRAMITATGGHPDLIRLASRIG